MAEGIEGYYAGYFSGKEGQGFAMLAFVAGELIGVDPLGVQFDGEYHATNSGYAGTVTIAAPPGGALIQGVNTGPAGLTYQVEFTVPGDFAEQPFISIATPLGPVNVRLKRLRGLKRGQP